MSPDMPFAAEVAGAILSIVILTLAFIATKIVKGDDRPSRSLPSDHGPDLATVLAAIENLRDCVVAADKAAQRWMESHEHSSQQRSESLVRCLTRQREQQEIDERFEKLQREIEKLRNGKPTR